MQEDENPFAAPATDTDADLATFDGIGDGLWRDGARLVLRKTAVMPDRCARCNSPAHGLRLRRQMMWHTPWLYLLILFNLLIYVIIALIVSHRARLDVGICALHLRRRRISIAAGWLIALAGVGLIVFAATDEKYLALIVVGFIAIFAGLLVGVIGSRFVNPARIDDTYVWLGGVHPDYLAGLPSWRG